MTAVEYHTGANERPGCGREDRGGEERSGRVPAGKAGRRRSPNGEPRVACLGRPGSTEQPLHPLVDDQALGTDQRRHRHRLTQDRRIDDRSTNADEVPDPAEVAEVAGGLEHRIGDRVAAQPLRAVRRPSCRTTRPRSRDERWRVATVPRRRPVRGRHRTPGTTAGTSTTSTARPGVAGSRRCCRPARPPSTRRWCGW